MRRYVFPPSRTGIHDRTTYQQADLLGKYGTLLLRHLPRQTFLRCFCACALKHRERRLNKSYNSPKGRILIIIIFTIFGLIRSFCSMLCHDCQFLTMLTPPRNIFYSGHKVQWFETKYSYKIRDHVYVFWLGHLKIHRVITN
jgi:hypothetical protein